VAGHVTLRVTCALIALFCAGRGSKAGAGGLDDQGNVKNWLIFQRSEFWIAIAAAFAFFALVDVFMFFNSPPPALNGVPNR
jgi:hypothetical protein